MDGSVRPSGATPGPRCRLTLGTPPTVTISADTTDQQTFDQPGVTLIIDNGATITKTGNQAVRVGTNSTIIVNSGGTINAVTKSGTNEFHGSVGYYYTDDSMMGDKNGDEEFNFDFEEKTFVATLGGPIIKDKLFFFVAYD